MGNLTATPLIPATQTKVWSMTPRMCGSSDESILKSCLGPAENTHVDNFKFAKYTNLPLPNFESLSQLGSKKSRNATFRQVSSSSKKKARKKSETSANSAYQPRKYRYTMMDPLKNKKNYCDSELTDFERRLRNRPMIIKLPSTQKSPDGLFNKPKKYSCISCPRREFYHLATYLRHVRKQHKEELLICEICKLDFTNPSALQRHQRSGCRR